MKEEYLVEPTTGGGAGYNRALRRFEGEINSANAKEAMAKSFGSGSAKDLVNSLKGLASRQSLSYPIVLKAALDVLQAEYSGLTVESEDDETGDEPN